MRKTPRCWVGLHAWHVYHDQSVEELDTKLIECTRCGKRSTKSSNVAARIGWPGHTGS